MGRRRGNAHLGGHVIACILMHFEVLGNSTVEIQKAIVAVHCNWRVFF